MPHKSNKRKQVSAKIKKVRAEGKPQKQAVAIALSEVRRKRKAKKGAK